MSELLGHAHNQSSRLQQSGNIRTFLNAHVHRGRLHLRLKRKAVRGRFRNFDDPVGDIQLQLVVSPGGRRAPTALNRYGRCRSEAMKVFIIISVKSTCNGT